MKTVFFGVYLQDLDDRTQARICVRDIIIEIESYRNGSGRSLCDIDTANCQIDLCYRRKGLLRYERRKARGLPALDGHFWRRFQRCLERKSRQTSDA